MPTPPPARPEWVSEILGKLDKGEKKLEEVGSEVHETHAELVIQGVRIDRVEKTLREHARRLTTLEGAGTLLASAASAMKGPSGDSLPPPPKGLGKVSDSGVHKFTEQEMESWQMSYKAARAAEELERLQKDENDRKEDRRKLRNSIVSYVALFIVAATIGIFFQYFASHPQLPVHIPHASEE